MDASEKEQGPWYAVHHGYEVQICDAADEYHRTGAVYSLAKAAALPTKPPTEWKTMVITLKGNLVLVDIDGKRVTTFDPDGKDVPGDRQWYEPKRRAEAAPGRVHRPAEPRPRRRGLLQGGQRPAAPPGTLRRCAFVRPCGRQPAACSVR